MASSALGLVRVMSNAQLTALEKEQDTADQAAHAKNITPLLQGLAKHVMDAWEAARDAKNQVLPRLQRAQRARIGVYDNDKLRQITEFGGSTEYARVTANKIRIVESWLRDVYSGQTDKPWAVNPTPKPAIPSSAEAQVRETVSQQVAAAFAATGQMPDPKIIRSQMSAEMNRFEQALMDEARDTCKRMEARMNDQLMESDFGSVLADFLGDLATYPSAILKGPILRKRKMLTWVQEGGVKTQPTPKVEEKIVPEFERVDPFRAYPAPGAQTAQDGYFIQHHTFTHSDLYDLIGLPGYDEEAIRAVIHEGEGGGLHNWLGFEVNAEYKLLNDNDTLISKVFEYDALEYSGPVKGKDLLEWGLTNEDVDDADAVYESCIWMIGQWVIKAQVNYDPLGQRAYSSASYEDLPGEFWGMGLPDILDDVQGVVNAAVRSLVNNMGMASGPQVAVNIDRMPPDQDITHLVPWYVWQLEDSQFGNNSSKAIEFFQPDSNVTDLITVIEKFYQFADDFSLIPRYMAGADNVGGAGRTASGLSMLMDSANKGLKGVVSNVDAALAPLLTKLYNYNMMYDEDPTIKGDAQVVASGAVSLMRVESMQLRRNEFLQVTANPYDMQIIGPSGRAEVLRSVAGGLDLNTDKIVPPEEDVQANAAQAQQQQMLQAGTQGQPPSAQPSAQPAGQTPSAIGSQEVLQDGSAVTDNFSPNALTP